MVYENVRILKEEGGLVKTLAILRHIPDQRHHKHQYLIAAPRARIQPEKLGTNTSFSRPAPERRGHQ
jgi:hypothetical protein